MVTECVLRCLRYCPVDLTATKKEWTVEGGREEVWDVILIVLD